jgi:hypothetical protein
VWLDKAFAPCRPLDPKAALSLSPAGDVVWGEVSAPEFASCTRNDTGVSIDEPPPPALCDTIEDKCLSLLNVLDVVHCMSAAIVTQSEGPTPEISAAFVLLEEEICRVVAGLREISLRADIRCIAQANRRRATLELPRSTIQPLIYVLHDAKAEAASRELNRPTCAKR